MAKLKKKRPQLTFLNPNNLSDNLWYYVDDHAIEIVVQWPTHVQQFKVTWKKLDRLRKQAADARAAGRYKP